MSVSVGFAAVHARMRAKVLAQQRPVLLPVSPDPRDFLSDVCRSIPQVVPAAVGGVAPTTATLTRSLRLVGERECSDRLDAAAVVAAPGRGCGHERPREIRVGPSSA